MKVTLTEQEARVARAGRFVRVELGGPVDFTPGERARSAFVARVDGRWVAWANVCRHRAVELDFNGPLQKTRPKLAPLAEDGFHLMCHSHGALYGPGDGRCISGPCPDAKLHALDVREEDGAVVLSWGAQPL
jgi:nitrite reductase/ring-hydroxylating ferredoxin subunit